MKLLNSCVSVDYFDRIAARHYPPAEREQYEKDKLRTGDVNACRDVAAGQRTQYVPLLLKAALAQVPGALQELAMTEQLSKAADGQEDPRIAQYGHSILDGYVAKGDRTALLMKVTQETGCGDPPECTTLNRRMALVHWTAYLDAKGNPPNVNPTPAWTAQLPPDVVQVAINEGHALYAATRERK